MRWRVAPRVRDLALRWLNATGEVVWADTISSPGAEVTGPVLEPGETFFSATGEVSGTAFRVDGPLHGNSFREELPRSVGDPLVTSPGSTDGYPPVPDRRPPVWPFAVAIALLCTEWLLRRKVGLR